MYIQLYTRISWAVPLSPHEIEYDFGVGKGEEHVQEPVHLGSPMNRSARSWWSWRERSRVSDLPFARKLVMFRPFEQASPHRGCQERGCRLRAFLVKVGIFGVVTQSYSLTGWEHFLKLRLPTTVLGVG